MMKERPIDAWLQGYVGYLRLTRRQAEFTVLRYTKLVGEFSDWLGDQPMEAITVSVIDGFMQQWQLKFEVRRGRLPSNESLRQLHNALASFFKYLDRMDALVDEDGRAVRNPMIKIDRPKRMKKPIDFLHPDEDERLLDGITNQHQRIVIFLLRFTGLRLSEAVALRQHMIDLENGRINYQGQQKGGSPASLREIPIVPILYPVLVDWLRRLDQRGLRDRNNPVLYGVNWKPLGPSGVKYHVYRAAAGAGLRPCASHWGTEVSAHTLRRTFATWLLNLGVRAEVVARLMGHTNTKTLEDHYAEVLPQTVRDEVMKAMGQ